MKNKITKFLSVCLFTVIPIYSQHSTAAHPLGEISHVDAVGSVHTMAGEKMVQLREIATKPNIAPWADKQVVIVLFDPETKIYSWRLFYREFPDTEGALVKKYVKSVFVIYKDGKFYDFLGSFAPYRLIVHSFGGSASDMNDAAEKALSGISNKDFDHLYDGGADGKEVLLPGLTYEFTVPPRDASIGRPPVIADVRWREGNWTVLLKGRWTEEITLDADFRVISMRKVDGSDQDQPASGN